MVYMPYSSYFTDLNSVGARVAIRNCLSNSTEVSRKRQRNVCASLQIQSCAPVKTVSPWAPNKQAISRSLFSATNGAKPGSAQDTFTYTRNSLLSLASSLDILYYSISKWKWRFSVSLCAASTAVLSLLSADRFHTHTSSQLKYSELSSLVCLTPAARTVWVRGNAIWRYAPLMQI